MRRSPRVAAFISFSVLPSRRPRTPRYSVTLPTVKALTSIAAGSMLHRSVTAPGSLQ
jgi:hypothetical protein